MDESAPKKSDEPHYAAPACLSPGDCPQAGCELCDPQGALAPDAARVPEPHNYCNTFEEEDGWWSPVCACGAKLGPFPDPETAADGLMQHAWDEGYAAALRDAVKMAGGDRG